MKVSVVVPTFKRPQLLQRCLEALAAQSFDPASFEIIIVDDGGPMDDRAANNGSAENTQSVINSFRMQQWLQQMRRQPLPETVDWAGGRQVAGGQLTLTSLSALNPAQILPVVRCISTRGACGPAAARNLGWQAAAGEIIAFTDDDCIPDVDWLSNGVAALSAGAAGVWGRVVVPLPPDPTDYELDTAGLERAEFITANCFYRRTVLAEVGGFDERFTTAWREDSDLYFTLLERGHFLVRAPFAVVVHPVRPAPAGISLRQQKRNLFNALLYKKHPHLYRQRIQILPPLHYYMAVGGALLALISLLLKAPAAVGAWFTVWLVFTLSFIFRRMLASSRHPRHVLEMVLTSALIPPLAIFWRLRGALKYRVWFF